MIIEIMDEAKTAVEELIEVSGIGAGDILVIGCSTSEIIGDSVPTRAIHTKNRLKYVYIFDNGFARQYRVNVLYSDSESALVECVPNLEGKLVIVDDYLYDGKALK